MIDVAPTRRDDTACDRSGKAEGVADGENAIADARLVAVAKLHGRERGLALDLNDTEIGPAVATDDLGGENRAVLKGDRDLVGILDDMIIGHDVAIGRDDKARA